MGERTTPHVPLRHTLREQLKDRLRRAARSTNRNGICPSRWVKLHTFIQANSRLSVERINLPGTDVTLHMTRPYIMVPGGGYHDVPIWSDIWPSGVVLAGMVAREPSLLHGRRVLELGPGIGVTAVAALRAGADLVVVDVEPESLVFCAFNALDHVGIEPKTLCVNWRTPELFAEVGEGFSLVLAADVLYQLEDIEPLLALLERIVVPGGELWLAHPERVAARRFVKAIRERGWSGPDEVCHSPWRDPQTHEKSIVTVHRLRKPAARPS